MLDVVCLWVGRFTLAVSAVLGLLLLAGAVAQWGYTKARSADAYAQFLFTQYKGPSWKRDPR